MVQEEMSFKGISYLELKQPFSSAERNYLCNFIESIMRNNPVKLFWIWAGGSGGDV